jgi:hypothetical protein
MTYELSLDDNFLPMYGNTISIPANTVLWRGFDPSHPAVSDRPAYYGAKHFAQGYANKYGTNASPFITSRPIELLDIRYMKVLLSQLFEYNKPTKADEEIITATTISFGLCSLEHQIKLFKHRYKAIYNSSNNAFDALKEGIRNLEKYIDPGSIYEQPGCRIAETSNDAFVMGFLKELFHRNYDGYVAPSIITPFHVEKKKFTLNSELILFNPERSGIKLLKQLPSSMKELTINGCILSTGQGYMTIDTRNMDMSYYGNKRKKHTQKGGTEEIYDDYNHLYSNGDKQIINLYKLGTKHGKRWTLKPVQLHSAVAPGPTVDPIIFRHYNLIM